MLASGIPHSHIAAGCAMKLCDHCIIRLGQWTPYTRSDALHETSGTSSYTKCRRTSDTLISFWSKMVDMLPGRERRMERSKAGSQHDDDVIICASREKSRCCHAYTICSRGYI